jgi:protein-tyrosine-phosphatase
MAEALLRARLDDLGVDAVVASVGRLYDGERASGGARAAMAARGLDLGGHRSRRASLDDLRRADLVLTMERDHVRRLVVADPSSWPRTFALRELVRRAERIGARRPDEPLADWLARAHEGRSTIALIDPCPEDDVDDPIGGPTAGYLRTAELLDDLLDRLVRLVLAPAVSPTEGATP